MPSFPFLALPYFNPISHIKFFLLPCSEPPATPASDHTGWVENWLENAAQTQELSKDENSQCCHWEIFLPNRSPRSKTRSPIFKEADSQVTNCISYRSWTAVPLNVCPFTESQNHFDWKGPLRSSPTFDWTPPCQLDYGTKHHVQSFLEYLQGWWLYHLPRYSIPMFNNLLHEEIPPDVQSFNN